MTREVITGGSYCDVLPSGEYAALVPGGVRTHLGFINADQGAQPLYVRITNVGGFKLAGQGSNFAGTLLWAGDWMRDPRIPNGQSGCIFDRQGELHIIEPGPDVTSQGYRYVAQDGTLVLGDATYGPLHGLNEYTDLGDGLLIGQGNPGGGVRVWDGEKLRVLEDGVCTFVRANRDGDLVAVCFWKAGVGSVFYWLTVDDLRSLPVTQDDVVVTPDPVDPEPEKPMTLQAPNMEHVVAEQIRLHPEVNTKDEAQRGKIIDYACEALGGKPWGRKARNADGSNKNTDGLTYLRADGLFEIYDAISGGSGGASWEGYGPFRQGENGYWAPHEPTGSEPPPLGVHQYDGGEHDDGTCDKCGQPRGAAIHKVAPEEPPPSPVCNCKARLDALEARIVEARLISDSGHAMAAQALESIEQLKQAHEEIELPDLIAQGWVNIGFGVGKTITLPVIEKPKEQK